MSKYILLPICLLAFFSKAQTNIDKVYLDSILKESEQRIMTHSDSNLEVTKKLITLYNNNRMKPVSNPYSPKDTTIIYYKGGVRYTATYDKKRYAGFTHDFEAYFMPGIGYGFYQPSNDSLGLYSGLNIEYLIYGRIQQNDRQGPSHSRFYAKLALMSNSKKRSSILVYGLGLNLSIERNPKRNFMVPYFGLEACAMSGKDIGNIFQLSPLVGFHVFSKENLYINIHGGYVYPTRNFENLKGYFGSASINFSLW